MAVAFVRNHTGVSIKTAGTTNINVNISTVTTAGNLLVAYILFDNAATASKPIVSSIAKAAGETNSWVFLGAARSTSTSAGAFASGEMWCIRTTVSWPVASYTVTLDTSVTMKATITQEFSGVLATLRSTVGTNYSTTTTAASATTTGTTPVIGDLVLGFTWQSNSPTAPVGDTDTAGGSWSTIAGFGSSGSTSNSNNAGTAQYKILTSATHQTYNNSAGLTAGNGAVVAILPFLIEPTITQAAYRIYDDGTESGSTALAAQNTNYAADITSGDLNLQVRVRLQSTTAIAIDSTDDFQLQWERRTPGSETLVDNHSETNFSNNKGINTVGTGYGQTFLGNGNFLSKAGFYLARPIDPVSGNMFVQLYAHTGTYGTTNGKPTGSALATSLSLPASALTASNQWFEFTFDLGPLLANGTPYALVLFGDAVVGTSLIGAGYDDSGAHPGILITGNEASWAANEPSSDLMFRVYTAGVPASVTPAYFASNLSDNAATTNRLTGGTGTFAAGKTSTDGLVDNLGWSGNNYTELLYSVTLKKADLANSDTLRFRVVRNGSNTGFTYTQTPTINITKTPVAITQAAYRFYADGTETGSTALATQNTTPSADISSGDVNLQLRTLMQSTSVANIDSTDDFQLQWEKNASGSWSDVITGSNPIVDSYDFSNFSTNLAMDDLRTRHAQSFKGDGRKLVSAVFRLNKSGTVTGTVTAALYAHDGGTFGGTGLPTGSALATSTNSVTASTIVNGNYTFTFDGTYTLVNNTPYWIAAILTGGPVNPNFVALGIDGTSPTHVGSGSSYVVSSWTTVAQDILFEVRSTVGSTAVIFDSANLTDAAATTNRLTGGTGTFIPGEISETGLVTDLGWSGNNYTELLYSVTLKQADLANGDTLRFRVLRNGATTDLTYTQTPTISITASAAITQAAYRFYADGPESAVLTMFDSCAPTTPNPIALYTGAYSAAAQSFLGDGKPLARASFWMYKSATPDGIVKAELYAHSGTYGDFGSRPTGVPLATSVSINSSALPTSFAWIDFDFDGSYVLTNGIPYFISITSTCTSNLVYAGDRGSGGHAGLGVRYDYGGGVWSSAQDVVFQIYSLSGVLPLAPQNTGYTADLFSGDVNLQIRTLLQTATNDVAPTDDFQLQWEKNTSGSWTNVGVGGTTVVSYDSPNLTNGAATTNCLTGGTGTFAAGKVSEDGLVDNLGWTTAQFTELLYSVTLKKVDLSNSDTLRFRVVCNGSSTGFTYTQTPTISIITGAPVQTVSPSGIASAAAVGNPTVSVVALATTAEIWNGTSYKTNSEVWNGTSWRTDGEIWNGTSWMALGVGAPAFTPASITGLGLWLEADSITGLSDGAALTTWPDASGNGRHAYPRSTAPVWRSSGIGGKPAVEFSTGPSKPLIVPGWGTALSGKSEYTLFYVISSNEFGTSPLISTAPTSAQYGWITEFSSDGGLIWGQPFSFYSTYATGIGAGVAVLLSLCDHPTNGPKVYKNSVEITSFTTSGGGRSKPVPSVGADVLIGAYYADTNGLTGKIAAVLWYDRYLTDTERQQVENYLKTKWGL